MRSALLQILAVTAFLAFWPSAALAGDRPSLDIDRFDVPDAEIETKMLIPDAATFRRMLKLDDTYFTVQLPSGKKVRYGIEFYEDRLYRDRFQDGPSLQLYDEGDLLRERARYELNEEEEWEHKNTSFQAKNGAAKETELDSSLHTRSEIRGKQFKSREKFERQREESLAADSEDEAVRYSRESNRFRGKYETVVSSKQKRTFLAFWPIGDSWKKDPTLILSLDPIQFTGHVGKKGRALVRMAELELHDDLSENSPKIRERKLLILSAVSAKLQKRFGLKPTRFNKYEMGVMLTVLSRRKTLPREKLKAPAARGLKAR